MQQSDFMVVHRLLQQRNELGRSVAAEDPSHFVGEVGTCAFALASHHLNQVLRTGPRFLPLGQYEIQLDT